MSPCANLKTSIKNIKPAKRYSKALIEMACSNQNASGHTLNEIYDNFAFIIKTISENKDLETFLENPVVSKGDKKEVLKEIFSSCTLPLVLNFLILIAENNRLNIIYDIFISFKEDIKRAQNILNANIKSAIELDESQKQRIISKLEAKTGKKITPDFEIDESILGGILIKINDTVIDLSIKKRIENLKNKKIKFER